MPSPFLQTFQKKEKTKPHSYVSDLYNEPIDDFFDEELSPAAARLRDQKLSSEHKDNLKIVRGKK